MKTVTFSNTEILVLKEYLNCNPCEACCILVGTEKRDEKNEKV